MLGVDLVGLGLPLDAEWWICQQVIELLAGKAVLGEAVAELDVVSVLPLDHHVGTADGKGFVVVVLPEDFELGVWIQLTQELLGDAEHTAGPAGRIVEGPNGARSPQDLRVWSEQQVHHEPNNLARREVIAGRFVRGFAGSHVPAGARQLGDCRPRIPLADGAVRGKHLRHRGADRD